MLHRLAVASAGLAAGVALTLLTVSGTARPVGADQAENAYLAAQKAQVIATTFQLDKSGFHDLEEQARAGTILSGALGSVRRGRVATQATEWPESLKPLANDLVTAMSQLEEAIRTEDAAKVVEPATLVHGVAHDLSAAAYNWLSGSAGSAAPARGY